MPLKQSSLFLFEAADDAVTPAPVEMPEPIAKEAEVKYPVEEMIFEQAPPVDMPVVLITKNTRGRKKLTDLILAADLIDVPANEILFQKKYYSIGLVADMFKVKISLIRFWENEFDILKPKKNGKGDRHFRPEDIVNLKLIYHLLREKKYTIEGAREFLKKNKKSDDVFAVIEELKKMRAFLLELKVNL